MAPTAEDEKTQGGENKTDAEQKAGAQNEQTAQGGEQTSEQDDNAGKIGLPPNQFAYAEALWKLPKVEGEDEMVREIPIGFAEEIYDRASYATIAHDARTKLIKKGIIESVERKEGEKPGRQPLIRFIKTLDELYQTNRRMPSRRRGGRKAASTTGGRKATRKAVSTRKVGRKKTAGGRGGRKRQTQGANKTTTRRQTVTASETSGMSILDKLEARQKRASEFMKRVRELHRDFPEEAAELLGLA